MRSWRPRRAAHAGSSVDRSLASGLLVLGDHSYIDAESKIYSWHDRRKQRLGGRVLISSYCSIGDVTLVTGGNHPLEFASTFPFPVRWHIDDIDDTPYVRSNGDISIGNDVWIGTGATLLSGARIGDGAVVGAGAVVRGDVRPYAVVIGNPAVEIRRRFDDETVDAMLDLRWWDWPERKVRANVAAMEDVLGFLDAHRADMTSIGSSPAIPEHPRDP